MKTTLENMPDKPEKISTDYPEHIDPKTGRFKKGFSGNPDGNQKGVLYKMSRIKNALLSFFEDNYLNTGGFMQWVRTSNNEQIFFEWLIKHVVSKDVNTKMELSTTNDLAEKIKEARERCDRNGAVKVGLPEANLLPDSPISRFGRPGLSPEGQKGLD